MSSVWKVHVWFTGITSLKHKHFNRVEHGVCHIYSICAIASRPLWFWFDPTQTSYVLMSDCLCKYFHSEVAEVNVSSWPSCFLWHSKTFQLRILLLFSAREPWITLMTRQTVVSVILKYITAVFTSLIRNMMTFWSCVFIYSQTRSAIDGFHTCFRH